jgi:hypothetical protein
MGKSKRRQREGQRAQRYTELVARPFVEWKHVPSSDVVGPLMIYALVDKRDEKVRYVGFTSEQLAIRLARHFEKPTNRAMKGWLESAKENVDIRPLCAPRSNWQAWERGWIAWFRERGGLLNVDPGGICRDEKGKLLGGWRGRPQVPMRIPVRRKSVARPPAVEGKSLAPFASVRYLSRDEILANYGESPSLKDRVRKSFR